MLSLEAVRALTGPGVRRVLEVLSVLSAAGFAGICCTLPGRQARSPTGPAPCWPRRWWMRRCAGWRSSLPTLSPDGQAVAATA